MCDMLTGVQLQVLDLTGCDEVQLTNKSLLALSALRHLHTLVLAGELRERERNPLYSARIQLTGKQIRLQRATPLRAMPRLHTLTLSPHIAIFSSMKFWYRCHYAHEWSHRQ